MPLTAVGFIRPCRRSGFHLFRRLPACGPVSPGFCPVCFPIKYRFPVWAGQGVLCFMGFQGVPDEKSRLCETLHRTRAQPGRNVSEADCSTGWAFLCFMGFQGVPGEKSRLCETLHRTAPQAQTPGASGGVTAPRNLRRPGKCMVHSESLYSEAFCAIIGRQAKRGPAPLALL